MTPHDLVTAHLPLVDAIATSMIRRGIGRWSDREEMTAWGSLGLCEAAANFREGKGASFATFAFYRIRGAMVDGARLEGRMAKRGQQHQAEWVPYTEDPVELRRHTGMTLPEARAFIADRAVRSEVEEGIDRAVQAARVREAIAALPERERALVEAVDLRGERLQAAGADLELSKSWASRIRSAALDDLRWRLS